MSSAADQVRHPRRRDNGVAPALDELAAGGGAGPLWLSRTGARLSVRSLNAIVAGVMASAGIAVEHGRERLG